jgi:two-component system, OmpR family, sensor kinase
MAADRFSLRAKLVVAVLALVTCALSVMAVATVTALRRYLIGRLDAQLTSICVQIQPQLDAGANELNFGLPAEPGGTGVRIPSPFLLESLDASGTVIDSVPRPLPATAPLLHGAALSRSGPFIVAAGSGQSGVRWRVRILTNPQGQHVLVAASMSDVDSSVRRLVSLMLFVGLGVLIAMAVVGFWLVRTSLRPLVEIERTSAAIAAGDLSRRVPQRGTRSEVGRLGHAFNVMIERIEHAFAARASSEAAARSSEARALRSEDKMRQFFADASHELRTPLTTIRGFAELYRQGAVRDPLGSARLAQRIEDEARRMGLLVEDLMLLARLDEQRPLAAEPVDLTVLATDAVEDAHAIAPGRQVSLDLPGGSVVVTGDEERLRQVIRNLVTNALAHTPPDASVTVRVARAPGQAILEVADTGPGLTPEQRQRVFERFYRADPARSRRDGSPGTGLGLSIVAAIAAAHNGTVAVDSAPDEGATFRVTLPAAGQSSVEG